MIHFQLLGRTDLLREDGVRVNSVLAQPKRVALLAYLALARPRGLHRRDALLALFWPELQERQARAALRQALFFLRRSLGSRVFAARGATEVGIDRARLRTDVEAVEAGLAGGGSERGPGVQREAVYAALEAAVERPLLDGLHVSGLPEFERWLEGERRHLRGVARRAAARLTTEAAADGDLGRALRCAELGFRLDPLDAAAAQRFLELKLRTGDRSGAIQAWKRLEALHRRELGEAPGLDFQAMLERVAPAAEPVTVWRSDIGGGEEPRPAGRSAAAVPRSAAVPEPAGPQKGVPEPTSRRGRRRVAVAVRAAGFLGVAAVIGAVALYPGRERAPDGQVVAVFPPTVRGPGPHSYVSESLASLIAESLEEGGAGSVISPHAILEEVDGHEGPIRLDVAAEVAASLGAGRMVLTEVAAVGDSLLATASLYRTGGGEEVRTGVALGELSDLSGTARLIARRLLARLAALEGRSMDALAARSTDSLRALRQFAAAEAHYRAGRLGAALTGFTDALRIDSTFGLAWYRAFLISPAVLGSPVRASAAEHLAVDRLPVPHGLLIAAARAVRDGDIGRAEELAARAAALEDDAELWAFLGRLRLSVAQRSGGSLESAREALVRARELDAAHPLALRTLAAYGRLTEDDALVDSLAVMLPPLYPRGRDPALLPVRLHRRAAELDALRAMAAGRWADAVTAVRRLEGNVTGAELGDFAGIPLVRARMLLAPFVRPAGPELDDCIRALRSWAPGTPRGRAERHYLLARLHLAAGEPDEALRLAAELEAPALDTVFDAWWRELYGRAIRMDAALRRGAPAEAARAADGLDLSRRDMLAPVLLHEATWSVQWLVAESLFRAGRPEDAARWYAGIGGEASPHLLQPRRLRTAMIRERLGYPEQARQLYQRIAASLDGADPELQAPLDSARRALARLDRVRGLLWVDDGPENNLRERRFLEEQGVAVTVAVSTAEALKRYDRDAFQLVISDIGRYEEGVYQPRAGLELLSRLRQRGSDVRLVFYTSERAVSTFRDDAVAGGADGITADTEELYRLIGTVGERDVP